MTLSRAREDENLPPVTVAIPAYDAEAFLADAVESVRRQDYRGPVSIVILDDGSTDRTLEIAKRLAEGIDNIRVHTQSNRGRAGARNRLVELVETEFLAWLDADDLAPPNWLSEQTAYLLAHPRCVAVIGQGYAMTAEAWPIGPMPLRPLDGATIERQLLAGEAAFYQSCVIVRKSAVERAGGYDGRLNYGEDCDLWLRMAEAGELSSLPACHLYYRKHAAAGTVTADFGQRERSLAVVDEARARRGLPPLERSTEETPSPKKDDWNSRIYWIVLALRSANPYTALSMAGPAILKHTASPAMWIVATLAVLDAALFFGNRTPRLAPGMPARFGELPKVSFFRLALCLNQMRRKLLRKTS